MWIIGMPNLGHTMETGKLLEWRKRQGEKVGAGEALALVESDKVTIEIESPGEGLLLEVLVEPDATVPVGGLLAIVGRSDEADAARRRIVEAAAAPAIAAAPTPAAPIAAAGRTSQPIRPPRPARIAASPAARRLAEELAIDLVGVTASAPDGIITRDDVERAAGAGARIVMLHGFGGDASLWELVGAALPARRRSSAPELPGHGGASVSAEAGVEGLALAMAGRQPFAGQEPMHLVGHSLGAAVAIALAARLGARALSLTLIAPLGFGRSINQEFVADYLAGGEEIRARRALGHLVGRPDRVSPVLLARTIAQMGGPGAGELARIAAACFPSGHQIFDGRAALAGVQAPIQAIWGREDMIISPSDARSLPEDADLHMLSGAGHLVAAERAACVAALIESFATRHDRGGKG